MDLYSEFPIQDLPKKTLLVQEGDRCLHSYFVIKGCIKSYVLDQTGKEHILQFAPENWMITDLHSLLYEVPATTYLETIEATTVRVVPSTLFSIKSSVSAEQLLIQNQKLLRNIAVAQKRLADVLGATSKQRYLNFLETYPGLAQRLPLKHIAAYIGVTPEYLSNIRRQLMEKP